MDDDARRRRTVRIEAALWIVLGVLAFLAKDNPRLVYPDVLSLFLALLASNLGTSLASRLAPKALWLHALTLIAGFAAIAGLQKSSGGPESSLWVLYLLPLFTAAILFDGRELAWTAVGACAANAAVNWAGFGAWSPAATFELALKTGILASAAGATWLLSRSEREAEARARRQRAEIGRLEESVRAAAAIAAGGAGAAHDLSTPLMVIRAYAQLHRERLSDDPGLARDLSRIDSAAAFCQELAAGLLRPGEPARPHQLAAVVERALALAEPVLHARCVVLERALGPGDAPVLAPRQDLERVVLNLVSNAAKAAPDGGRVRVRVHSEAGGGHASVTVEDDGPGIPPSVLSRLFQPFATTRATEGGTGLGLYLSRETARRLGGSLDADNRPGGGARFTLRLPLAAPAGAYSSTSS